jgi:hypothetical protein
MSNANATSVALNIANGVYSDAEISQFVAAINEHRRRKTFVVKAAFRNGDKVEFLNRRNGLTVEGVITKICPKNIMVRQTNGSNLTWRVSPSLLKKVA